MSTRLRIAAGAGASLGATIIFTPAAEAATFTVTNLDDSGGGSLREAVEDANAAAGADSIVFESGLSGTITLAGTEILIGDEVSIEGPGADQLTVDGDGASRIFYIDPSVDGPAGGEVSISGLTLADGDSGSGPGGAIRGFDTALTLSDAVVAGNEAGAKGGGVSLSNGIITVLDSTFEGNEATNGGGLYARATDTTIERSTFTENYASSEGGGVYFFDDDSTEQVGITLSASTLSDNVSMGAGGGGITVFGGTEPTLIENSTISGNYANDRGGGVYLYTDLDEGMTIRNSTIVDNEAVRTGGGVYRYSYDNEGIGGEDNLPLVSTIVADNTAPDGDLGDQDSTNEDTDVDGSFILSFSLIEDGEEAITTEDPSGSNLLGVDPQLGPLTDNGGPTQTHLPALTSPAAEAGLGNGLSTEQRGLARTLDATNLANAAGSDGTDIGAVELTPDGVCNGLAATVLFAPGTPITGSEGNDVIVGTAANDQISALGGADTVCSGDGADSVNAGAGKDFALGEAGKDKLAGKGGKDKLKGGPGKDKLKGGAGKDKLSGQGGKDTLKGQGGKDKLKGGPGKDKLRGGPGKDKLNGGGGKDSEVQ